MVWQQRVQRRYGLVGGTVGMVVLADWLIYDAAHYGINLALLAAAVLALLVLRYPRLRRTWAGRISVLLAAGIIASLVEEPGLLNETLALLALVSTALIGRLGWRWEISIWLQRWGKWLMFGWLPLLHDLRLLRRWQGRRASSGRLGVVGRWVLPVVIAAVFVALFRLANPIIELYVSRIVDVLKVLEFPAPLRIVFWLCTMLLVWGVLRIRRRLEVPVAAGPPPIPPQALRQESGLVVRTLILCNAVFLGQNILLDSAEFFGHFPKGPCNA